MHDTVRYSTVPISICMRWPHCDVSASLSLVCTQRSGDSTLTFPRRTMRMNTVQVTQIARRPICTRSWLLRYPLAIPRYRPSPPCMRVCITMARSTALLGPWIPSAPCHMHTTAATQELGRIYPVVHGTTLTSAYWPCREHWASHPNSRSHSSSYLASRYLSNFLPADGSG
jgi:hypothetical protein